MQPAGMLAVSAFGCALAPGGQAPSLPNLLLILHFDSLSSQKYHFSYCPFQEQPPRV